MYVYSLLHFATRTASSRELAKLGACLLLAAVARPEAAASFKTCGTLPGVRFEERNVVVRWTDPIRFHSLFGPRRFSCEPKSDQGALEPGGSR